MNRYTTDGSRVVGHSLRWRALQRETESLRGKLRDHFDECRACTEGAWEHALCPDGEVIVRSLREVSDEIEWMDGDS